MIRHVTGFLLLLLVSSTAFAANKPAWTRGAREFVEFRRWESSTTESSNRSHFDLCFSSSDEIIISFVQSTALNWPMTGNDQKTVFVVLFISPQDGTLIKRVEWPLEKKPAYRSTQEVLIKPLPEGGYAVVINGHLRLLDSDLNIRYDKALENKEQRIRNYKFFTPFSGPFFILEQSDYTREVIDSRNFEVVENLDGQNLKIRDISGDTVIVLQNVDKYQDLSLKTIGGDWNNIGYVNRGVDVRFAYNGALTVSDYGVKEVQMVYHGSYSGRGLNDPISMPYTGTLQSKRPIWFSIKNRQRSTPVFYEYDDRVSAPLSARHAPIALVSIFTESGVRVALDFTHTIFERFEVYDLVTQKRLLKTKKRLIHHLLDDALSGDGRRLAVLRDDRLELYIIPVPPVQKKK